MILRHGEEGVITFRDNDELIIITGIQVPAKYRRKGVGTLLINKLKAMGKNLMLRPNACFDTKSPITQEQLLEFYYANGFEWFMDGQHMIWKAP
jgi:GNAT superfamily N-acetyltransferase